MDERDNLADIATRAELTLWLPWPMPRASSVSGRADGPGGPRRSFRDARARILGGLRGRGWVWWLSMLWVVTGAGWVVYAFACTLVGCTSSQCTNDEFWFVQWNGEPGVIAYLGNLAETAWPLLAVLVLVAGLVRLRGWRPRNWRRTGAWAGAWVAGIALIVAVGGVALRGSEAPSVGWVVIEVPILAAWLALGAWVNRILSTPALSRDLPETSDRSRRQASS